MKNIWNILAVVALLFAVGCDDDVDEVAEQREDIVTFLTSKHSPLLIAESDLAESLVDDPDFYSVYNNTTFRYIQDYYNVERESKEVIESGATITITFWCYDFSNFSTPTDTYLYYTNDVSYKEVFLDSGLNSEYWDFTPKSITLGSGQIISSIDSALVGCRVDDTVEFYLTFDAAYGSTYVGMTSLESPIAFFCVINSVENR